MPWADILHACDFAWWEKYRGVPEFAGIKLSADRKVLQRAWGVHALRIHKNSDKLELLQTGAVGWGGNSGFHCLNLAVQMQPQRIILVGFDMRLDRGVHWHGAHQGLNNPTAGNVARWRRSIDATAPLIAALGIDVVNASAVSALEGFRKMPLPEALEC